MRRWRFQNLPLKAMIAGMADAGNPATNARAESFPRAVLAETLLNVVQRTYRSSYFKLS